MKSKKLLLLLLMALIAPWAMNAQNSIPFNEGFEGMTSADDLTAAGWTLSTTESGTFLAIETTASNVYEGSKSLNLDAWNASSSSSVQYLGLPLVAGNLNTLQLSFAYKVTSGTINVGYLTDATDFSTFTSLVQYSSSSSFAVKTVDLSEAPATAARLAIKYTGWYRCYLDAFVVGPVPTCEAATSITASNITATSATITWEGEVGDYWNLDYNGTVVNNISALTYNLTGLTEGTNYTVKVQNVCDNGATTDWVSTTFRTPEICPENTVCVGEGTATSNYLPGNMFYYNSLTQQIYTAEELGEAGTIVNIAFYSVQDQTKSHTFDIYMVATDKESFENTTDWIAVTSADLVGSATVTLTAGWNTFELDYPFEYNGTSNVAIIVDVTASEYESGMNFYVYNAPTASQAIRVYSDPTNYDPTNPSSYTGTLMDVKNRLRLLMGEPPACGKPTGLEVNYEGGTTATVTWNAVEDALSYGISINGEETTGITTTSFNLTELDLATVYEVKVNATCAAGTSDWTSVSFMTDLCLPEDMCAITFQFADSYGDGWNGAAMQVYDYDTISEELTLLGEYTIESGSSANYTLNVCDGRFLVFFWSSGNYDSECSYAVYDNLGDPIFSGSGAMSDYELFFMNCNSTCRMPRNFAASEITGHEVTLSWTELGEATSWTLAYMPETDTVVSYIEDITTNPYTLEGLTPNTKYYAIISPNCEDQYKWSETITWTTDDACPKPHITVVPTPTSAEVSWTGYADDYTFEWAVVPAAGAKDPYSEDNWYYYDNGTYVGSVGLGGGEFHWAVMFPAGSYEGSLLSKVKAYDVNAMVGTLAIYNDGETAPADQVTIQDIEFTGAGDWVEFTTNATIDPTKNVWVVFDAVDGAAYPIGTSNDDNGDANGRWVEINGTWYDMANVGVTERANMVRALFETGFDPDELDWQPVADATSPVTLSPLTPETQYAVRIMALCGGEDGESKWSTVYFWTPSLCATPFDLAANDVAATSANLSWTGYQESYNLRYRQSLPVDPSTPATIILEAHDVWEDGSGYQMLFDADAATYGVLWTENHYIMLNDSTQYSGGDLPSTYYDAFEYMIPAGANGALDDTINVVVDDIVTITIPAGTYDYVILNPTPGDRFYIAADNGEVPCAADNYVFEPGVTYHFTMQKFGSGDGAAFEEILDWGDWTTVENVPNPYAFTGLTPETAYEWQVQGVNCSEGHNTDWSEIANFTTTELTTITQTVQLTAGTNWFSPYVDITLENLQAALAAATPNDDITIKSASANVMYTKRSHSWRPTPATFVWNVLSKYDIIVASDCEITLEGMPIDPSGDTITILGNGATTWLGFPFSESMTLTDAFASIVVNNDKLKSATANTSYTRGRWQGTSLTTLEPGQGYLYTTAVNSSDRTFVYPTPSKAANNSVQPAVIGNNFGTMIQKCKKVKTDDVKISVAPEKSAKDILIDLKRIVNIKK